MSKEKTTKQESGLLKIVFVEDEDFDFSNYSLMRGKGKKHRGKHRSETKGKGHEAFLRNKWQKNVG